MSIDLAKFVLVLSVLSKKCRANDMLGTFFIIVLLYTIFKLLSNYSDIFYIYYSLDGIKDYGLLDTGCDSFIVRENYQTDYVEFTDDEIREIRNGPNLIKKEMDRVHFNKIDIGRISYKDMYGYFAIDERIKMDATAEKEHRVRSILGYSFFKNHIIQLDFKNNLFYIE